MSLGGTHRVIYRMSVVVDGEEGFSARGECGCGGKDMDPSPIATHKVRLYILTEVIYLHTCHKTTIGAPKIVVSSPAYLREDTHLWEVSKRWVNR